MSQYRIHPAIGIARIGNSAHSFYIAPDSIGGLPTEYDPENPTSKQPVEKFKDGAGQIRRQAARFQIFRQKENGEEEALTLGKEIESIEWRVHLANKKAAWFQFSELAGDQMLGKDNSYEARNVQLRNDEVVGEAERQKLIIDPGPRSIDTPGNTAFFDARSAPADYTHVSFPPSDLQPQTIKSLGELKMQTNGDLLVLGGLGNTGGKPGVEIKSFAGANGYFDDTADGPVTATVRLKGQKEPIQLKAWVIAASPKYAPELVNPVTLNDIIFDMAVRHKGADEALFKDGEFQEDYTVDFTRQILPIFQSMRRLQWVANVAAMVEFATPDFDLRDPSEANRENREQLFSFLRPGGSGEAPVLAPSHQEAFATDGFPLMPLNAGTNPITNINISKFLALTPTQYFFFKQWAAGRFQVHSSYDSHWPNALDQASVGNCVGAPMSPGIEVTWSLRNPALYENADPYRIVVEEGVDYAAVGLSPSRDETLGGGCQPGDLSKRMAIPWQADFSECSTQPVSIADPEVNQIDTPFLPPALLTFWWPAQSPWQVYTGSLNAADQILDAETAAGTQVFYQRGLMADPGQVVQGWSYLGFILNQNRGPARDRFAYFVERERNFGKFSSAGVGFNGEGVLETTVKTELVSPPQGATLNQMLFLDPNKS